VSFVCFLNEENEIRTSLRQKECILDGRFGKRYKILSPGRERVLFGYWVSECICRLVKGVEAVTTGKTCGEYKVLLFADLCIIAGWYLEPDV
jgi:hypothetical protein